MFSPRWSGFSTLGGGGGLSAIGQFSNSTDVLLVVGSPKMVPFNQTDYAAGGVSVVDPGTGPTRLSVTQAGTYRFDISLQLVAAGGQTGTVTFWAALNGSPLTNSASSVELGSNSSRVLPYVSLVLPMTAGQYLEWLALSSNANMSIEHFPAVVGPPAVPAIPSAIAGVFRLA